MKRMILFFGLLIAASCVDDVAPEKSPVAMRKEMLQSILEFSDLEEMLAYVNRIAEDEEAAASDGFESFNEVYYRALNEISSITTEEDHERLLAAYSDVLTLVEDEYIPVIDNFIYGSICNRGRLYKSGGYIHKALDSEHLIFTEEENEEALMKIRSLDGLDLDVFRVIRYQKNEQGLTGCGSSMKFEAVYFDNHTRCTDDRRVYIGTQASYTCAGPSCSVAIESKVWGKKRNSWCNWRGYSTKLYNRNCSLNVRVTLGATDVSFPAIYSDYSSLNDQPLHTLAPGILFVNAFQWDGKTMPAVTFNSIHLEGSSRGVGTNHWAIIDCK